MDGETPRARIALRHRVEYAALATLGFVMRLLPRRAALALGAAVGRLGWWTRIRRGLVLRNLARARPEATPAELRALGALSARNFGRTTCEFLRFPGERQRVLELVRIDGLDVVEEVLAEGRGAMLVTAHLGAWALYVTALAEAGVPSALLVGVQTNPLVNDFIMGIPGDAVQFISKGKSSPREILKALKANKVIVLVADHYSSDQNVYAPFLGENAFTQPLPGALVAKHKLPLLCMTGHRTADTTHRVTIRRVDVPALEDGDALRLEVAVLFNAALGEAIREHPEQYFWYHDRWKVRRKASPPRYSAAEATPGSPGTSSAG